MSLAGSDGGSEIFETTDDHPWWILDEAGHGRWVDTEDLRPGMRAVSRGNDGAVPRLLQVASSGAAPAASRILLITSVMETERIEPTYNLTVADFHTYFVGQQKVLVHNCGEPATPTGSRGSPLNVPDGLNRRGRPFGDNGRDFSGHAFDRMQRDGITPSVVENTIQNGAQRAGNTPGTSVFTDSANGVEVVVDNTSGTVITVIPTSIK